MKKQSEVKTVLVDDDYYPRLMKSGLGEKKGATKIPRSNRPIRGGGYYTLCRGLCPKNPMSDCAYRVVDSYSLDDVGFAPYLAVVKLKHGEASGVTELKLDYDSRMTVLGVVGEYRLRSPEHHHVSLQYSSDDYEGYSQLSVSIPDDVVRAFVAFKDTVDEHGKEIHFEYYGKFHGIIAPIPSHMVLVNKNTDTLNAEELKNLIMHYPTTWLNKVVCLREVSHKSAKRFCDRREMPRIAHKKWRIVHNPFRLLGHYRVRKINSVAWKRFLLDISRDTEHFWWIRVKEI